ncbi:MAG: NUDIX hydrolase [Acetobacteraceae bacterium]
MDGFVVHEVAADVAVRVVRVMPDLPAPLEQEVERLWRVAAERVAAGGAGRLFNGQVFSADAITPPLVTGHLTEFRRIVAQMECPDLFAELGVRPLAVCGLVHCADGVVVGRRHRAAIYQAGMWQLPPAGSVDAGAVGPDGVVNLRRQLLGELQEELGLPPDAVGEPRPLCIVEHPGSHVSDFGMALVTSLSAAAVLAAHRSGGNGEYEQVLVVPEAGLAAFVAQVGEELVPPAREFLVRAGLANRSLDSSR